MAEIKPLSNNENRVRLADVVPLDYPYAFYVYPTNRCNFKCNYCLHALDKETLKSRYDIDDTDLSLNTFEVALNGLKEDGRKLKSVIFVGQGEPLLNRDLPAMISLTMRSGITEHAEVITNGSLLTPDVSDKLISAGLSILKISVQGVTTEKYKSVCGVGLSINKLISNIEYYYSHKLPNQQMYIKTMDVALDDGDEQLFFDMFNPISDRIHIENVKPVYDGVAYKENPSAVVESRYGDIHRPRKVCPPCFFQITIFPDGGVCHCETIYKPQHLGNVNEKTMLEMWRSEKVKDFWRGMLKYGKDHFPGCAACCAPDDCSRPEDTLDDDAMQILTRMNGDDDNGQ
ncbi:MAG: radical SAM protein [Prevotellaceae bacterium]|jgi:radical SAM protein with 4Fe4S-binding SPASM domain|nr:radical SAM protein [Prevotellaceae bacterium]